MKVLCIYHAFCADGFGAAWIVRRALGDGVEFHAASYGQEPPDVTGRDVLMVDFSYKRSMLDKMAEVARSILVLDHHKTAAEDLDSLPAAMEWPTWHALTATTGLSVCAPLFSIWAAVAQVSHGTTSTLGHPGHR